MSELPHLTIPVRMLTPFWSTGAACQSSSPLSATLVDSLRTWYAAIVRGMGGTACDTAQSSCTCNREAYDKGARRGKRGAELLSYAGLCPACQLFGAPGWPRRFTLNVDGFGAMPLFFVASPELVDLAGRWLGRLYDGNAQWATRGQFDCVPIDDDAAGFLPRLAYLFDVVARYGALGAATHHGFGQFIPLGIPPEMIDRGRKLVAFDARASRPVEQPAGAFSLGTFFSRVYKLDDAPLAAYVQDLQEIGAAWPGYRNLFIPCAFELRYKSKLGDLRTGAGSFGMRPWFRAAWGRPAANLLLHETLAQAGDERCTGRIHVSHIYRLSPQHPWMLKLWGHVPPDLQSAGGQRHGLRDVIATVHEFLTAPTGMFPGSKPVVAFIRKDVL